MRIGLLGVGRIGAEHAEVLRAHVKVTELVVADVAPARAKELADRIGTRFAARITTVVYFGLFVTLDETGADWLVPVSTLGDDAFQLDERHQALVGQRIGETFALGDRVRVELVEADPVQGTLLFRLDAHEPGRGAVLARAAWKKGGPRKVVRRPSRPSRPRRSRA